MLILFHYKCKLGWLCGFCSNSFVSCAIMWTVELVNYNHPPGNCFHGYCCLCSHFSTVFPLIHFVLVQALLHFIYWDSLPDIEELTGINSNGSSTLMAQHLLAAADRYGLDRLRLLCEANLCKDVAINTVATTLALAEQHHCFQLKTVCLRFVATPGNLSGDSLLYQALFYNVV